MKNCSKKIYLSSDTYYNRQNYYGHDTNVFTFDFSILKQGIQKLHQGDSIACKKCGAVLNKFSVLEKTEQKHSQQSFAEEEQKNPIMQQEEQTLWHCEFCGQENLIAVEAEEVPVEEDVVYLKQSAQQMKLEKQNLQNDQTFVFCIDTSGSMTSTTEVKGQVNLKHGLAPEELEMLKAFMEPGDEYQLRANQGRTFVSRKQCVMAAIETQLNEMKITKPNCLVGIVAFNNEVTIIGDGTIDPTIIAGDKLDSKEAITAIPKKLASPISQTASLLIEKCDRIKEKGQTALGPALLASVQMATEGKAGSMVILCTDGLANRGLGAIDSDPEKALQFYNEVGAFAKERGVAISVITIKGEGCRMDVLQTLAEQTMGNVTRVSPENLSKDFASILSDEVVGTNVSCQVQLHRVMRFRHEFQGVNNEGDQLTREVGNATVKMQLSFEYSVKRQQELKESNFNLEGLKQVPFQIRVEYTGLEGDKYLRVVTKMVETTFDLKEAERDADVDVIHKRQTQMTTAILSSGDYIGAQSYNAEWKAYINDSSQIRLNNAEKIELNKEKEKKLEKIIVKQSKPKLREAKHAQIPGQFEPVQQQQQQQQMQLFNPQQLELFNPPPPPPPPPLQQLQLFNPPPPPLDLEEAKEEEDEDDDEDQDKADLFEFQYK